MTHVNILVFVSLLGQGKQAAADDDNRFKRLEDFKRGTDEQAIAVKFSRSIPHPCLTTQHSIQDALCRPLVQLADLTSHRRSRGRVRPRYRAKTNKAKKKPNKEKRNRMKELFRVIKCIIPRPFQKQFSSLIVPKLAKNK